MLVHTLASFALAGLLASPTLAQTPPATQPPAEPPEAAAQPSEDDSYVAYGVHDLATVLGTRPGPDGKDSHFLDMVAVRVIFDDLAAHARNYPTTFRSDEERARARHDAEGLGAVLDTVSNGEDAPIELLLVAGQVHAMAHNLDVPTGAAQAKSCFERILAREPDNAAANFHFGVFLASSTQFEAAVPRLQKAADLGIDDAWFSLGMTLLSMHDTERALPALEKYGALHPGNEMVGHLIEEIRAGTLQIEDKQMPN